LQEKVQLEQSLADEQKSRAACENENQRTSERSSELESQNTNLRNTNQLLSKKNVNLAGELTSAKSATLETKKQLADKERALEAAAGTYNALVTGLKTEVENGKVTIKEMEDQLKVALVDRILFPAGTVDLNDEGKLVLNKLAKILKNVHNKRIQVEGHSDGSPVSNSLKSAYPTNWELSARRATSVVRYLQEKGVDPKYLAAVALAHYHPLESNKTPKGRQNNRRIEIILTPFINFN
jgi:chemotaxis protein MotB